MFVASVAHAAVSLADLAGGRSSFEQASGASVLLAIGIGLLFLAAAVAGMTFGLRAFLRLPGGRPVHVLLIGAFVAQCIMAVGVDYWSGDEILMLSSALTAVFADLSLVIYPNPAVYLNLAVGMTGMVSGLSSIVGGTPLEEAAMRLAVLHFTDLLVACRCVTALAWTRVLAMAYMSVLALGGRVSAGVAAILLLFSTNLFYTTAMQPHALGVLFGMIAVYHLVLHRPRDPVTPGWAAVSGLLFGVALSTHYLDILLLPVAATALFARSWRRPLVSVGSFVCVLILTFLILNPRLFLDWSEYAAFLRYRFSEISRFDAQNPQLMAPSRETGASYYPYMLASHPIFFIALAGLPIAAVRFWRTREPQVAAFLLLPLGLLAILTMVATKYAHYLLWVSPPLAIIAVVGVSWALDRLKSLRLRILLAAFVIVPSAWDAASIFADTMVRQRPEGGLLAAAPETLFTRATRSLPPGDRIGFSSSFLTLPRRAVLEGRIPESVLRQLKQVVDEACNHDIAWVDAPDSRPGGLEGAGIEWLYSIAWQLPGFPSDDEKRADPARVAGLVHHLVRIGRGTGGEGGGERGGGGAP